MLKSVSLLLLVVAAAALASMATGHVLPREESVRPASAPVAPATATLPVQRNITFPPEHCQLDQDCIGQNTTSRLYYDPNGRCDQKRGVCICLEGFKRLEFRVKPKRSYKLASASTYSMAGDQQPSEGYKYITKCVAEDESLPGYSETSAAGNGNGNPSQPPATDDLNLFLNSLQYYGQTCDEDKQCTANLICRQLLRINLTAEDVANRTRTISRLMANRVKRCRCPLPMHFNKQSRRCEFPYSPTFNKLIPSYGREEKRVGGRTSRSSSIPNGGLLGLGSFPSSVQIHSSSIDWKIFEIVLELAFLIGCLLGYKACSRVCCREDTGSDTNSLTYGYTSSPIKSIGPVDDDNQSTTSSTSSDHSDPTNTCDLKSDEESIIGHSSPMRKPMTPIKITMTPAGGRRKVSPRVTRKRKVSRFYSRARRCTSPYNLQAGIFGGGGGGDSSQVGVSSSSTSGGRGPNFRRLSSVSATMSRSSSASTRNLLVKVNQDDLKRLSVSTTLAPNYSPTHNITPCYTCRIYKEVYSPSARCKGCRSSTLSIDDIELKGGVSASNFMEQFDSFLTLGQGQSVSTADLSSMASSYGPEKARGAGGNNLHLPHLPPRHKQIRRSEEVGVPPHLRAPYRDNTPFWLK